MSWFVLFVLFLVSVGLERATTVDSAVEASKVPKIVDQVERINHPEGTNATFTCTIGSGELNGLKFEWLKDDKRIVAIPHRHRISVAPENFNSILRVIDLQPEDSGVYSCLARNAFGQDKISIKLMVKVELKWIEKLNEDEIKVPIGKQLHVPCNATGQPSPRIEWTRLDVGDSGQRQSLGAELRFGAISLQDSGFYECRASNGMDKDLVTRFKLSVMVLGSVKQLPGYDDKNFLLTDSATNKTYVLKIVNKEESIKELTDVIDEILDNAREYCDTKRVVNKAHFVVPKMIRTTGSKLSTLTTVKYRSSSQTGPISNRTNLNDDEFVDVKCNIKLCEFFDGITMFDYINGTSMGQPSDCAKRHERLYLRLGRVCNQLFVFLRTQQHLLTALNQIRSDLSNPWHLKGCEKFIKLHLDHLYPEKANNLKRKLVLNFLDQYTTQVKPKFLNLPEYVVHSDVGTKNILINAHSHSDDDLRICIIDFQDLQTGPQVADLAILMLYCVVEQDLMPFDRALALLPRWIFAGYQSGSAWPLNDDELNLVPSLMKLRLCQSLLNGQMAYEREPENSYVMHTNQRGWSLLELMCDPESTFGRPNDLIALWQSDKATTDLSK